MLNESVVCVPGPDAAEDNVAVLPGLAVVFAGIGRLNALRKEDVPNVSVNAIASTCSSQSFMPNLNLISRHTPSPNVPTQ